MHGEWQSCKQVLQTYCEGSVNVKLEFFWIFIADGTWNQIKVEIVFLKKQAKL